MKRYNFGATPLIVLGSVVGLAALCLVGWNVLMAQPKLPPPVLTEPQQRMVQKFGPDMGYELRVDAMKGEEFQGVTFHEIGVNWPFYRSGTQNLNNESEMAMSGPIPEQVRVIWRKSAQVGVPPHHDDLIDKIIGDETIEVGSRIPQTIVDDLKRIPRSALNLKFRMSNQGTLVGWDVISYPNFKPNQRDQYGSLILGEPVYSAVGGDFREAEIYNGEVVRKGWYIDKKTGHKIETDF